MDNPHGESQWGIPLGPEGFPIGIPYRVILIGPAGSRTPTCAGGCAPCMHVQPCSACMCAASIVSLGDDVGAVVAARLQRSRGP